MQRFTVSLISVLFMASPVLAKGSKFVNSSPWKPKWSKAFLNSMNSGRAKDLLGKTNRFNDLKEFCPTPPKNEAEKKLFWLALFKNITGLESSYNAKEVSDGPNGPVVGLLQISPYDSVRYGCSKRVSKKQYLKVWKKWDKERDKPKPNQTLLNKYKKELEPLHKLIVPELQTASVNIDCAIRIANFCARRNAPWIAGGVRGSMGAIGCFWQPMRKGTTQWQGKTINNQAKRDRIRRTVARTCKETFGTRNLAKKPHGFTAKEIRWAGLSTSTPVAPKAIQTIAHLNKTTKSISSLSCGKMNLFDRLVRGSSRCRSSSTPKLQEQTRPEIPLDGLTRGFLSDNSAAQ